MVLDEMTSVEILLIAGGLILKAMLQSEWLP
jgi:hypothetical protein